MDGAQVATLVFAGLAALGGVGAIVALLRLGPERRKLDAEAAQSVSTAAVGLLQPLQEEVDRLQKQYAAANVQVARLRTAVARLEQDVAVARRDLEAAHAKLVQHGIT